jgi:ribonucleoside-diphosphate reductase beta chain
MAGARGPERDKVLGLVAGFCIAETSVAGQLVPYEAAASVDDAMQRVLPRSGP